MCSRCTTQPSHDVQSFTISSERLGIITLIKLQKIFKLFEVFPILNSSFSFSTITLQHNKRQPAACVAVVVVVGLLLVGLVYNVDCNDIFGPASIPREGNLRIGVPPSFDNPLYKTI